MSLYNRAKTKIRVGSGLSEEFWVQVGLHQGSELSPLLFAIPVNEILEYAKENLINEIVFADDLITMSEGMEDVREKFSK